MSHWWTLFFLLQTPSASCSTQLHLMSYRWSCSRSILIKIQRRSSKHLKNDDHSSGDTDYCKSKNTHRLFFRSNWRHPSAHKSVPHGIPTESDVGERHSFISEYTQKNWHSLHMELDRIDSRDVSDWLDTSKSSPPSDPSSSESIVEANTACVYDICDSVNKRGQHHSSLPTSFRSYFLSCSSMFFFSSFSNETFRFLQWKRSSMFFSQYQSFDSLKFQIRSVILLFVSHVLTSFNLLGKFIGSTFLS